MRSHDHETSNRQTTLRRPVAGKNELMTLADRLLMGKTPISEWERGDFLSGVPDSPKAERGIEEWTEFLDRWAEFSATHADNRYAEGELPSHLRGHLLFGEDASCKTLRDRFRRGDRLHVVEPDIPVSFEVLRERLGTDILPMFIARDQQLIVLSEVESETPQPGDQVVFLARQNQIQDPDMVSSLVSTDI